MNIKNFISELKRRNVFKIAVAYGIAGWLIIQIVTVVEEPLSIPDWVDTVVILFVGLGFPLALVFAWAFEITPEGLRKTQEVDAEESITPKTGKKLNSIIIAVLSVALFFVLIERVFFARSNLLENSETANIETASVAVLPFVNMSSDQENEYFSDGLSEELLNVLAKVDDLKVAGRTSSFKFKGHNENLSDIAAELGVSYILEGSVRKSGNRLRITAQLIKANDGYHMWSEAYDRELTADGIFEIQEEISRHVMEELKVRLLPEDEVQLADRPTTDIEAYNAFLEATQREITYQPDDLEFAIQKYKEAIRLDPTFAEAYARLSIAYGYLHSNGNINADETKILMRENAEMAVSLDNDLGKAHEALGFYLQTEFKYDEAQQEFKKAVELSPNDASARMKYRGVLARANKIEESRAELYKAYELDPLSPDISNSYANHLVRVENRYEEAMDIINRNIERTPDYNGSYYTKAWLLRDVPYGELDNAFMFAYEAYLKNPDDMDFMWMVSDIARDLNMTNLAEYFGKRIKQLFPENHAGPRNLLATNQTRGDFDASKQIVDDLAIIYGERTPEYFVIQLSAYYYAHKEYQTGIDLLRQRFGDVMDGTLNEVENDDQRTAAIYYLTFLDKIGEDEKVQTLKENICTYKDKRLAEMRESGHIEIYNELDVKFWCQIASEEYDDAARTLERLHFELNSKANWPMILTSEIPYYRMEDSPEYKRVKNRIFDDLTVMRGNVVEYLKDKGEWREDWGTDNSK